VTSREPNQTDAVNASSSPTGAAASRPSEYKAVPGPTDRETFFAAQNRQRRAGWAYAALAALTAIITGLPLSIAVAPIMYIATMPIATVMSLYHPRAFLWGLLRYAVPIMIPALVMMLVSPINYTLTDPSGKHAGTMPGLVPALVLIAVLLVLPGGLVFLGVWHMVRSVFRHAGVGGVLLALGARAPDGRDLEEQRLVHVVEEMAIAAGLPAPRVMVIDRDAAANAANAAAVGWSISDATVVVTRPLIEDLTRDQTQAVIARVIASIGNGDLRIAFLILSVFETIGLVRLALHGPHRSGARRTLGRFLWLAIRRSRTNQTDAARSAEEQAVMALIARAGDTPSTHETGGRSGAMRRTLGCVFAPVLIPLDWTALTIRVVVTLSAAMFAGPVIGAMWRRREMLADAMAVQLTRNPDGLAAALERMREVGVVVPRGAAVSHLFAAWWTDAPRAPTRRDAAAAPAIGEDDGGEDGSGALTLTRQMNALPDVRIAALKAMGAHVATDSGALAGHSRSLEAAAGVWGIAALLPVAAAIFTFVMVLDLIGMSITLGAAGGLSYVVGEVAKKVLRINGS